MMQRIISVFILLMPIIALANTGVPKYQYTVDLGNIVHDRVYVELLTPEIEKNKITFYIPKIVPGTYAIYDFGRFVSDFSAVDIHGNALKAERTDINTFVIYNAKRLNKISYWVDDSFDATTGVPVHGMSGTNIEEGRDVIFNAQGFVGYFKDMKEMPFEVRFKKDADYFGATAMPAVYPDKNTEIYEAESYNYLVDMPILFAKPDTTTVQVGEAEVLIAVSSPSGRATSSYIAEQLTDVLQAEREYMGGKLPVNKYAFLMHFLNPGENVGTGALEHNYSSLYVLPDVPQEHFIQPMKDIAAHEFFHIVTPLNVHSEQIQYFDFNDPEMSKHLWMYEGVTEYFSHHAQLVHDVTTMDYFLSQMQDKIASTLKDYDDALPFTELSKNCLTEQRAQYGNVYQKGALIGLCLDVILRKASSGETGLMDLMLAMMQKFGDNHPFRDRRLFRELTKLSYPEVGSFLKKYVDGKTPLPLQEIFKTIGIEYTPPGKVMQFTYGNISLNYNTDANRVIVVDISNLNAFGKKMGYQIGDEITSINGRHFDPENPMGLFYTEQINFVEGESLVVEVVRKDPERQERIVVLSAPIEKVETLSAPVLKVVATPDDTQKAMQANWMQGAKAVPLRS